MNQKDNAILAKIKLAIFRKDPEAEVILFGSRARGEEGKNSDWDILILLKKPNIDRKTEMSFRDELFNVELELGIPISTFVYSKKDWESRHSVTPLFQNIQKDGVIL